MDSVASYIKLSLILWHPLLAASTPTWRPDLQMLGLICTFALAISASAGHDDASAMLQSRAPIQAIATADSQASTPDGLWAPLNSASAPYDLKVKNSSSTTFSGTGHYVESEGAMCVNDGANNGEMMGIDNVGIDMNGRSTTGFAVSWWVKQRSYAALNQWDYGMLLRFQPDKDTVNPATQVVMHYKPSTQRDRISILTAQQGAAKFPSSQDGAADNTVPLGYYTVPHPVLGQWYHFVWSVENRISTIYKDGVGTSSTVAETHPAEHDGSHILSLGGRPNADWFTDACFKDLRIYKRALSSAEVTELHSAGANPVPVSNPGTTADPHVTNVKGERFDIFSTGSMRLLQVPRLGGIGESKLTVDGRVDRTSLKGCNHFWIRNLRMSGTLLDQSYEFGVNTMTNTFLLRAGNASTEAPDEFTKLSPTSRVELNPKVPSNPWYKDVRVAKRFKIVATMSLQAGPAHLLVELVREAEPKKGRAHESHLNFEAINIIGLDANQNGIGGLLGADDHTEAMDKRHCQNERRQNADETRGLNRDLYDDDEMTYGSFISAVRR